MEGSTRLPGITEFLAAPLILTASWPYRIRWGDTRYAASARLFPLSPPRLPPLPGSRRRRLRCGPVCQTV